MRLIEDAERSTAHNTRLQLTIALSYGSRQEIVAAAKALARDCADGKLSPEAIDEAAFAKRLFTDGIPDPDLLIRTAGELRVSNFLLWQISYAELWVTQHCWPSWRNTPRHIAAAHPPPIRCRAARPPSLAPRSDPPEPRS